MNLDTLNISEKLGNLSYSMMENFSFMTVVNLMRVYELCRIL